MSTQVDASMLAAIGSLIKPVYSIAEILAMGFISRSQLYADIRADRLKIRKNGRSSYVLGPDFAQWLLSLPLKEGVSIPHRDRAVEGWKLRRKRQPRRKREQTAAKRSGRRSRATSLRRRDSCDDCKS